MGKHNSIDDEPTSLEPEAGPQWRTWLRNHRRDAIWAVALVLATLAGSGAAYAVVTASTVECEAATSIPNADGTVTIPLICRVVGAPSGTPTPTPSGSPTGSPSPSATVTPSSSPTATPSTSSSSPTPTPTATTPGSNPLAGLARIPWEGGPAYWAQFPKAIAGGWTNPSFFPISIFYESFSSEAEVRFDKSYGVNSYIAGYPPLANYSWLQNNGMYWLSPRPNNNFPAVAAADAASGNWPGVFLDDEPDGRFGSAQADLNHVLNLLQTNPENGRFRTFNFTQIVAGDYGASNNALYTQMVNSYRGPISADVYWYTIPNCGPGNPAFGFMLHRPVDQAHCRTSSSYGGTIRSLRQRDAADGVLKPIWQFIENLNGGPGEGPFYARITPNQLKGAAMNSIINEARGLMWFNTSLTGPCQAGVVLRQAQYNPTSCVHPQMNAMKEINLQVLRLAPIINTQSYAHTFGPRLDTMLKWHNGSAYIFAMINGAADSGPGARTFTLPAGLAGATSIQVVDESRSVPVTGGQFTDTFAAESTYHIYKVTL